MTAMKDDADEIIEVPTKKKLTGIALVNKTVQTPYGLGIVLEYRENDQFYAIKLTHQQSYNSLAIIYTKDPPVRVKTAQEQVDELNVAYEALEKMRRMNLEMECFEAGVHDVNYEYCTTCLLYKSEETSRFPRLQKFVDDATSTESTSFPRIRSLWGSSANRESNEEPEKKKVVLPRIQKLMNERRKASAHPCLICASPSCSEHSSANFKKEGITLCLNCERLFELDFIVGCVTTPDETERSQHIDHMIDRYDRCLLLLKYSAQYIEKIAQSLEQQKEQQNKIGLGSSGVGVLSGVLGIAAAATILTPAGPPLLIASLFFGGSATAVQTGTEAMNYFSEPHKLADRIIALHGMVLSILRVTSTLRDAMMREHVRTDIFEAETAPLNEKLQEHIEKNRAGILASANVGRTMTLGGVTGTVATAEAGAIAGAEVGAAAGARGATAFSRAGTAAARTIRFARFAGGALSAAVLVMEANAIQSTLKSIHEGSPCDKAQTIRQIATELQEDELPTSSELDEECQAYLSVLANRPAVPPEVAAVPTEDSSSTAFPQVECNVALASSELTDAGAVIVNGESSGIPAAAIPVAQAQSTPLSSSSTLLQRITAYQNRRHEATRADEVVAVVVEGEQTRDSELSLVV